MALITNIAAQYRARAEQARCDASRFQLAGPKSDLLRIGEYWDQLADKVEKQALVQNPPLSGSRSHRCLKGELS